MAIGVTFDTGALIALERGDQRMRRVLTGATRKDVQIVVPAAVLAEWWRGGRRHQDLLESVDVEPLSERLAKIAGEAVAAVGATAIDAIVMASAAQRGDIVYTSDFDDLDRLRQVFPTVTVMRC